MLARRSMYKESDTPSMYSQSSLFYLYVTFFLCFI